MCPLPCPACRSHHQHNPETQTVEAQCGSEALKLLEERLAATGSPGVDAILKNHDPPESNGVRFLHRLREHPRLRNIPTVGEHALLLGGRASV